MLLYYIYCHLDLYYLLVAKWQWKHDCAHTTSISVLGVLVSTDAVNRARLVLTLKLSIGAGWELCTLVYIYSIDKRRCAVKSLYMNVLLFILKCCVFSTCAVVPVSSKAGLTCAGVVLLCAAAVGIFVAGEGERRDTHIWEGLQRNKNKINHSLWGQIAVTKPDDVTAQKKSRNQKSILCHKPCSKHLYPCFPLATVSSGQSPQVNWSSSVFDWHFTPRKQGLPWHTSEVFPQNFPLNPFGHKHPTTCEEKKEWTERKTDTAQLTVYDLKRYYLQTDFFRDL